MIVARSPVRVSFSGGGTDLPAYYERFGGMVLSAAISPSCHVTIAPGESDGIVIASHDYGHVVWLPAGEPIAIHEPLSLSRAVLVWFANRDLLPWGARIEMSADVPPGSGLGSSSAMTVALVAAIARHVSLPLTQEMLAAIACEIEIDLMQRPIGRQDQYASAIGGINTLTFERAGVAIEPLALRPGLDELLLDHLLLVSTRRTRDSATVLRSQRAASATDSDVTLRLHRIKELATGMREALIHGDLVRFGALLDESWHFKRGLARGVSSPTIDRWYGIARQCGAYGGKITGAGGGGFFLFCVPPERRQHVIAGLHKAGLRPLSFTFDHVGCVVQDGASLSHFDSRLSRKGNHYETANLRHS